jgi:outer membrane biogenesis lipoprotein LolB
MLRTLRLPAVLLGTALALLGPSGAFARDHDRDDWRRHERHEWREHEWREHHRHWHFRGSVYYGPAYAYGYYDRWGYFHPYRY